jgi:hypothetical protein
MQHPSRNRNLGASAREAAAKGRPIPPPPPVTTTSPAWIPSRAMPSPCIYAVASTDGAVISLTDGLRPGERIAINVPDEVVDGSRIQPVKATKTP